MNYIITVCQVEAEQEIATICNELELPLSVVLHAKGTVGESILSLLGIESNERRVVLTVANQEKTKQYIQAQKQRIFIGIPGHGIVVALPVKSIGGGKTVAYLNNGSSDAKYKPCVSTQYELIVAITNEGRTDLVMNAARQAGAGGGTTLHGKGTGNQADSKFMNVSIASEKEVVLIVAKSENKSNIMKSILEKAGPESAAGAVVFSMPVSDIAGFGIS